MAEVVGQDGRRWQVRRRWVTFLGEDSASERFRRRLRRARDRAEGSDVLDFLALPSGDDPISVVLGVLGLLFVLLALAFFGFPLLVALVELLLLAALIALVLVARVVLRRPWAVQARADDGTSLWWRVVGWRASGRKIDEVTQLLEAGIDPQPERTTTPT
jgi:hypothetical protein